MLKVNSTYTLRNPEAYTDAVLSMLSRSKVEVNGQLVEGVSLSHLAADLRDRRFQLPGNNCDQEDVFKALGFRIARDAKAGKNTRKGHQYIVPCTAVVL